MTPMSMNRRSFLGAGLGAAGLAGLSACGLGPGGEQGSKRLTVSAFGGDTQKLYDEIVYHSFDGRPKVTVVDSTLQSDDALAKMIAEKANPQIDMFQFSGGQEATAVEKGLTQKVGSPKAVDDVPKEFTDPDGQWLAVAVIPEGIVYNTEKIKEPPRSYRDFLKPEYQGHIAFPTITNGYGLDFLVMLAKAYGGGEADIDPGFTAMAKIAAKASIFKAAAEMQTLFSQGDVWIMPYDSSNAYRAKEAGLPVEFVTPEEGSPANLITHVIAKKSDNGDAARDMIAHALDPKVQAGIAEKLRWFPVSSATKLPGGLAEEIPVGQAALDSLVMLDRAAIAAERPEWTDRFNREIAK